MPQDRKGEELMVGDTVMVPCKVERIIDTPQGKFQNVMLVTQELHFPWQPSRDKKGNVNDAKTHFALNGKQVEKVIHGAPV